MEKYTDIITYAHKHNIPFGIIDTFTEVSPCMDFGMEMLDTEIFEMPCSFQVENAIVLCLTTPADKPEEECCDVYDEYYKTMSDLREISKPQYIGVDGYCVKLMMWCDWA